MSVLRLAVCLRACSTSAKVEAVRNVMAHGDAWQGK